MSHPLLSKSNLGRFRGYVETEVHFVRTSLLCDVLRERTAHRAANDCEFPNYVTMKVSVSEVSEDPAVS